MNIAGLLAASALSFPDRPAVSLGIRTVFDYRTLAQRTARLAGALRAGHAPGSYIGLAMHNRPEYLEILFACWHAGLVAVPMNARLHPRELAAMARDCEARLIFASNDIADGLSKECPDVPIVVPDSADYVTMLDGKALPLQDCAPDDTAWLFYTSGTTGQSKGAMLSHRNLMAMAIAYLADVDFLTEQDALLHLAATSHASGLFCLSFIAKAANNILPESGGYDAAELAQLIANVPNLTFFVPATLLRRMVRAPEFADCAVNNIRTILLGAAPVYPDDLRAGAKVFGPRLWNGYGQGESPCTITAMRKDMIADAIAAGDDHRLQSVGIARVGTEVRIVDDHGMPLPANTIGEVVVRGDTVMASYLGRTAATAETLRGGWLHTGDLGRMDDHGFLTLLDRKKDLIISGGMNVYAREVEDVLLNHPSVIEAAVIGVPDSEWGEAVVAIVVSEAGSNDAQALDTFCLEHMARFKRPKHYCFVSELPKNAAGKVLKRALRAQYEDAS